MKRRDFLITATGAACGLAYSPMLQAGSVLTQPLNGPAATIDLTASPRDILLKPGALTKMFSFQGRVGTGSQNALLPSSSYLGPTIEVRTGQRLKINFTNNLPEPSIVHWHGLHLAEDQDGHPRFAVGPGESYAYDFIVENRAGLYWYHPHPHGRTGYQVYQGLAGLLVVRDDEEDRLNLPSGENEIFMVLQDRHLGEDNELIYIQSGHDIMMGKVGNTLLVNGQTNREQSVKKETYRLRLLNGGNALTYRLQWSDGHPIQLIGTDGGLLDEPMSLDSVLFSPGERLDIIRDFSGNGLGEDVELLSIPLVENPNAKPFSVYKFLVETEGEKDFQLPGSLSNFEKIPADEAVNLSTPKVFKLKPEQGIGWTIDGLPYEMMQTNEKERVKLGTTEIWEFDLTEAGMIHPMHIHGSSFQVLERINGPYSKDLVFDGGWKDTVAVLPGDRVRVIKRFNDHPGLFVYHCHILEHEDKSMMRNFLVE